MIIKLWNNRKPIKAQVTGYLSIIAIILTVGICFNSNKNIGGRIQQIEKVEIKGYVYTLVLKNQQIYVEDSSGKVTRLLLEESLLDMACYDINQDGKEELLVLTLSQEPSKVQGRSFGKELQFYNLEIEEKLLKPRLIYKNDISSVHPFNLRVGKLETGEAYTTVFVGVYKDTKYYKEVINRPFFFSWNGKFIERKWTGSYLSHNELMDLAFIDVTGDGADEIAVLEKTSSGTYKVSLYKWLNFGFDYLTTSKKSYGELGRLKIETQNGKAKIKLLFANGKEEVDF